MVWQECSEEWKFLVPQAVTNPKTIGARSLTRASTLQGNYASHGALLEMLPLSLTRCCC
jgi:hypothetical protein